MPWRRPCDSMTRVVDIYVIDTPRRCEVDVAILSVHDNSNLRVFTYLHSNTHFIIWCIYVTVEFAANFVLLMWTNGNDVQPMS